MEIIHEFHGPLTVAGWAVAIWIAFRVADSLVQMVNMWRVWHRNWRGRL